MAGRSSDPLAAFFLRQMSRAWSDWRTKRLQITRKDDACSRLDDREDQQQRIKYREIGTFIQKCEDGIEEPNLEIMQE